MRDRPYYITTAITYPNAKPHMGHALEWVQADVLARYTRLYSGVDVCFQIGLDEHGLKMQRAAEAAALPLPQFLEVQYALYREMVDALTISFDNFIRTTHPQHIKLAQAFWNTCLARGDIYKKQYRAWYNVKEEEFLGMADEVQDPSIFGVEERFLELIDEENYFFAASKYTDQVIDILERDEYAVVPANRKHELLNFIREKGLQDISISRDKKKLSSGIPVPGDDSQVMYVWFDALTNYITGAAEVNEVGNIIIDTYWPAALHCVGKDISRFHGLLWPAMLFSAGLPLPEKLMIHGFILSNGRKMSKSLGNVVDPATVLAEYGADPLRWYLISAIPTLDDGDFTLERLDQVYSSDLANDYGNLVSRVVTMVHKYCGGIIPKNGETPVSKIAEGLWERYHTGFAELNLQGAAAAAKELMVFSNRRIEEVKPWMLAKDEARHEELAQYLYELLELIRHISLMILPILPTTAERVAKEVFPGLPEASWGPGGSEWGLLQQGTLIGLPVALFPRREA